MNNHNFIQLCQKYKMIYFIYFLFFLANGPMEKFISYFYFEYFSTVEYGYFLSLNNIVNIMLPTIVATLAYNRGAKKINTVGILISVLSGVLIAFLGKYNVVLLIVSSIALLASRTVFNNSIGNCINFSIDEKMLDKFFSVRDLFLFSGISLGTIISSIIIQYFGYSISFFLFSMILLSSIYFFRRVDINEKVNAEEKSKTDIKKIMQLLKNKVVICLTIIYVSSGLYANAFDFVGEIGMNLGIKASYILSFLGVMEIVNAIVAVLLTSNHTFHKRKNILLFDVAFDVVPALIFAFTNNMYLFFIALFFSSIKDVLSPITFSYTISCFEEEDGFIALGILGSISSLISVVFPVFMGYFIVDNSKEIFLVSTVFILISTVCAKILLPEK